MNSTILEVIEYCLYGLLTLYIIWIIASWSNAKNNVKDLRRPKFVAWDVYAVADANQVLAERGVFAKIYDVDRSLCKLGLFGRRQRKLPTKAIEMLKREHLNYGFKIALASKSNKHLAKMAEQLGSPDWLIHMVISKSGSNFLTKVLKAAEEHGWHIGNNKVAVIGDKPTDMGSERDPEKWRAIEILTSPQGGYDIITENFPALPRWFDRILLKHMGVKRATHCGEFIRID